MMGLMLQSNDREVANAYGQTVMRNPLLLMVEGWAFSTYTHDGLETCNDPVTVAASERFLNKLRVDPADHKGDLLDQPW